MRVFITGATGFIGSAVVGELLAAGHAVLGLARSEAGAQALREVGAEVHPGSLEDLDSLRRGAASAEAVIHLGFNHDFSKFAENCALDQRAIEALGSVLAGTDRPFLVTAGLGGLIAPGQTITEDHVPAADLPFPRVSEQAAMALRAKGVSVAVIRLPQVHDRAKQGLVTYAIALARQKGLSAYVGDGQNRWSAVHVSDAARLYRLALERHEPGARYHAVAEEGVPLRAIAEAVGRGLKVPVASLPPEAAESHFGWMGRLVADGNPASSAKTRRILGWDPAGPGLLEDVARTDFSRF